MRCTSLLLAALLLAQNGWTIPYQPVEFMNAIEEKEQGADVHLDKIHEMVNHLARYAGEYPTKLDNDADHAKMVENVKAFNGQLGYLIKTIIPEDSPEYPYFVREQARLGVIAHNLDIPNAAAGADRIYQWLLGQFKGKELADIQQEYGIFLANSGQTERAITQLKAAYESDNTGAAKALAIAYLGNQDTTKGQRMLEAYIKNYPDDLDAQKLLEVVKEGKIEVKEVKP
ncbi:hypothetical protein KRX19_00265 [Cardiobacteriaceae bacterium TAE3-ERU3]|nr:hypothetical protein [Cardiobacteriaceae bacterium TAE3-ERU3]